MGQNPMGGLNVGNILSSVFGFGNLVRKPNGLLSILRRGETTMESQRVATKKVIKIKKRPSPSLNGSAISTGHGQDVLFRVSLFGFVLTFGRKR